MRDKKTQINEQLHTVGAQKTGFFRTNPIPLKPFLTPLTVTVLGSVCNNVSRRLRKKHTGEFVLNCGRQDFVY